MLQGNTICFIFYFFNLCKEVPVRFIPHSLVLKLSHGQDCNEELIWWTDQQMEREKKIYTFPTTLYSHTKFHVPSFNFDRQMVDLTDGWTEGRQSFSTLQCEQNIFSISCLLTKCHALVSLVHVLFENMSILYSLSSKDPC